MEREVMERLTKGDWEYEICKSCKHYGEPYGCNNKDGACVSYEFYGIVWDRLAAYEDTGLMPE